MRGIIAILVLTTAWIAVCKLWRKIPRDKNIEVKSFRAAQYCDDDCLHCENKDWCTFSEVKHGKPKY